MATTCNVKQYSNGRFEISCNLIDSMFPVGTPYEKMYVRIYGHSEAEMIMMIACPEFADNHSRVPNGMNKALVNQFRQTGSQGDGVIYKVQTLISNPTIYRIRPDSDFVDFEEKNASHHSQMIDAVLDGDVLAIFPNGLGWYNQTSPKITGCSV